jgi:hypothetical protein
MTFTGVPVHILVAAGRFGHWRSNPPNIGTPPPPKKPGAAAARLDPVNRPDLLPKEFSTVIDVAGFLTPSEEARLATQVAALERDTGFKLRVLAQSYPETPGARRCVCVGGGAAAAAASRRWQ